MKKSKKFKKLKRKIIDSWLVHIVLIQLIYWYVCLVFKTTKWEVRGIDNFYKHKGFIGLIWHSRTIMMPNFWNKENPASALVSPHRDGRLIAGLLHKFDIKTIDGSSNENAHNAAVSIIHALKNHHTVAIVPDGPLGPRMRLKKSAVYFAQKSGAPIICSTYSIKNASILTKTWDNTMFPKPFSKGIIIVSEPVYIPKDADEKALEKYRLQIENILTNIQNEADDFTGQPHILPEHNVKTKRYN